MSSAGSTTIPADELECRIQGTDSLSQNGIATTKTILIRIIVAVLFAGTGQPA